MDIGKLSQVGAAAPGTKNSGNELKGASSFADDLNRISGASQREGEGKVGKGSTKLGKDEFLRLFMEQLKHQDPLQPMQGNEFSQHMALFSQLEQQINMNQNLEKMLSKNEDNRLQAINYIGKEIEGGNTSFFHEKNGVSEIGFSLPVDGSEVKIDVMNDKGEVVRALEVGQKQKGAVNVKWDGKNEHGGLVEAGRYFFKVHAKDMGGKPIEVSSSIKGKVTGVVASGGRVQLLVGDNKIDLNDVSVVRESATNNSPNDKNIPGTNSEENKERSVGVSSDNAVASLANKAEAKELKEDKKLSSDRLNELMPIWYR